MYKFRFHFCLCMIFVCYIKFLPVPVYLLSAELSSFVNMLVNVDIDYQILCTCFTLFFWYVPFLEYYI